MPCGRWARPLLIAVALVGAATSPTRSVAQCSTPNGGANGTVVTATPTLVPFASPTVADFNTGYEDYAIGVVVTVTRQQAGNSFDLCIAGATAFMGGAKGVADLEWRRGDLSTFNPLSTSYVTVQAFGPADPATTSVTIYFRMRLPWATTVPGSYSEPIEYVAFEH
ncbi:MAG: hypothetical protein NVS1B4_01670 [Gemmatimonadaceae bacterium]